MDYFFIYETTCLINSKKYRGMHKTGNIDDGYLGSGIAFKNALNKYGKEKFSRKIIGFYNSYDELIEAEKFYVDSDWVKDDNNYNLKTGGQSSGLLSEESKRKISETLKRKYESGEIQPVKRYNIIISDEQKEKISTTLKERYRILEHHNKGVDPWNKGLKGAQVAWNKGLEMGAMSEEEKKKRSDTLKERWKDQEHHSKGVEPWNKGLKGAQEAWNKGLEMEKIECPHCGKFVDKGNAKRWHFDNCKMTEEILKD